MKPPLAEKIAKKKELTRIYDMRNISSMEKDYLKERLTDKDKIVISFLKPGMSVLDVGIGNGRLAMHANVKSYKGIDFSEKTVKELNKRGIKSYRADLNTGLFPFQDGEFDAVICSETIEHLYDPLHAIVESWRVLKKDGIIILTTPNIAFISSRIFLLIGHFSDLCQFSFPQSHLRFFTLNSLRKMMEIGGFKVIKALGSLKTVNFFPLNVLCKIYPKLFGRSFVVVAVKNGKPKYEGIKYYPQKYSFFWKYS